MAALNEIWKDVQGFEGLYQVSNLARVKSLQRRVVTKFGIITTVPERIRKTRINAAGYWMLALHKDGISYVMLVHRLVAIAFIPNPNNLPVINHINRNPADPSIENLEWCTYSYNSLQAWHANPNRKVRDFGDTTGRNNCHAKKVNQIDEDGNIVKNWPCIKEAAKELKMGYSTILKCLATNKPVFGFKWSYDLSNKVKTA